MNRLFSPKLFLATGVLAGLGGFLAAANTHTQSFMDLGYVIMAGFLSAAFIVGSAILGSRPA